MGGRWRDMRVAVTSGRKLVRGKPVRGTGGVLFVHRVSGVEGPRAWGISQAPSGLSVSAECGFQSRTAAERAGLAFWRALDRESQRRVTEATGEPGLWTPEISIAWQLHIYEPSTVHLRGSESTDQRING